MQKTNKKAKFLPSSCLLTVRFRSGIIYFNFNFNQVT